ncbi:uncharacterized protein LOC121781669 [Salvia splendens]|uniref:uncharacterized protein LOC121781669 n=1 Tax=Salvia splendens TaxID=180675 RepID=UPI001C269E6E|nr:uncharacterized protein LOC121781669 [Salvia splendens]
MEMEQEMDEEMEQELFEQDQFQEPEDQFPEPEPPQEAEFGQGPRASLSLSSQEKKPYCAVPSTAMPCWSTATWFTHGSCNKFRVHPRTVSRLWRIATHQIEQGQPVVMKGKASGYTKKKGQVNLDEDKFRHLSMLERSSIRKLAIKMDVSKSTAGRWVKGNKIRPHTNAIKPALTDVNKITRMRWSLSHIQPTISEGKLTYHAMHNIVHIDEKWFYMTKTSDRYYLLPEEDEPYRSCKSKRFITKVMFICAVSRPMFGSDGQPIFDGKIDIFPFTQQVPAKRKSKNRPRGTLETKPIPSVNKEAMRECLLNQIIPTIKAKWPASANKEIYIQQDNAKPHLKSSDLQFEAIASTDGFKFHLVSQPANSPDTNVLDLGFFRAIQSLQDDKLATNIDELLANVWSSFEELTPQTLNKVFLTLQSCLTKIIEVHGSNNYKIPHLNKDRLSRTVGLPTSLEVEENLIRDSLEYLQLSQNDVGGSYEIEHLISVLG